MLRKTLGLTLALLTAGGVPALAAPAPAEWQPCEQGECRTVGVPLDHARPDGERIDLTVARQRATDPARRIGTLVALPSWPSEPSASVFAQFSAEIKARFDVVTFDLRGNSGSSVVKCSTEVVERWQGYRPTNADEFAAVLKANRDLHDDCRARTGPLYDHISSAEVAEDIDVVRAVLGEEKISLFGNRYSTIAAQHYAARHGDRVRALVLDSPMDPAADVRTFVENAARVTDRTFTEWVRWNGRTAASPLHGKDVDRLWADALAGAERPFELGDLASGDLLEPEGWSSLAEWLAGRSTAAAAAGSDEVFEFNTAAFFCADFGFRADTYEQWQAAIDAADRLSPRTFGSGMGSFWSRACSGLPVRGARPGPSTAPEALITSSRHDESAPYESALDLHLRMPSGLVPYDGYGSGVYPRSACTIAVNDRYLVDFAMPARGTRCAAVDPPA